jgi:hypothetical protein
MQFNSGQLTILFSSTKSFHFIFLLEDLHSIDGHSASWQEGLFPWNKILKSVVVKKENDH